MLYFDGVIVVEGKGDVSYLSSFIDAEYVILNGYQIPADVVDYLSHIQDRKIIVMTDPDEAGISIEKRLKNTDINYTYKKVKIEACDKHGKHGVAECKKDEILRVLSDELLTENPFKNYLSKSEFSRLGLAESTEKREAICEKLHLGFCNAKTLFKRLNYNKITAEQIEKYGNQ